MWFKEAIIFLIFLCIFFRQIHLAEVFAGLLWFIIGFSVEKKIWIYYFRKHLEDKVASIFLVSFVMLGIYYLLWFKFGSICIIFVLLFQITFDFFKCRNSDDSKIFFWYYISILLVILTFFIGILIHAW